MRGAPLLVIAAGGTGGHMFPAQALSEAMLQRGWRVKLSTDDRGARYSAGFADAVEREVISSATFARGGLGAKLAVPFRIGAGVLKAAWTMWRDRPAAVAGFGGYPAIPAMAAAWLLRLPRMIHEQNGVLGRVNQLFARRVAAVACGTWPTELPPGTNAIYTGNPVRGAIAERAGAAYIPPGDYPMSLLVFGGSQGARVLSDVVPEAVRRLPDRMRKYLRVAQQAREEDVERVEAAYSEAGIDAEVLSFFNDMPKRLSEAQLVISRAGASSVADIAAIGRPSILVPLASAIRDEQTANARTLVEAQASILVPERALDPARLAEQIELVLSQPKAALQMAQAAFSVGRPDAAERLAELVEALAEGRPLAQEETAQ